MGGRRQLAAAHGSGDGGGRGQGDGPRRIELYRSGGGGASGGVVGANGPGEGAGPWRGRRFWGGVGCLGSPVGSAGPLTPPPVPAEHKLLSAGPTEPWSIREKLCLASSVMRSGDQNW